MTCPTLHRAMKAMTPDQQAAFLAEIGKQARYEGKRYAWGAAVHGGDLHDTQKGRARAWK